MCKGDEEETPPPSSSSSSSVRCSSTASDSSSKIDSDEWRWISGGIFNDLIPISNDYCRDGKEYNDYPPYRWLRYRRSLYFEHYPDELHSTSSSLAVYFSRHGESEYNVEDRIGGDPPLTPKGRIYAKALGDYFDGGNNGRLRICTSVLQRAVTTAEYLPESSLASFERTRLLNELNSGSLDGLSYNEVSELYPELSSDREFDKLRFRYPGFDGESYLDCCARVEPVLWQIEKYRLHHRRIGSNPGTPVGGCDGDGDGEGGGVRSRIAADINNENDDTSEERRPENILLIAHQGVLRCLLGYFFDVKPTDIPHIYIPQHTLVKMTFDQGKNRLEYIRFPRLESSSDKKTFIGIRL